MTLELDNETVSACEVTENGELSLECPVVCGLQCFGPICYQPQSDTYTLRSGGARVVHSTNESNPIWVIRRPRVLLKVHSLSDVDLYTSLISVQNQSAWSSKLLQRGKAVLQNVVTMSVIAQKYIDDARVETAARSLEINCEHTIGRSRYMAATSVTISALTCPLLIVIIIKLRSNTKNRTVPMRMVNGSDSDVFL